MDALLPFLTFGTLILVLCFAIYSYLKNRKELQRDDAPISTLARDGEGPNPLDPPKSQDTKQKR